MSATYIDRYNILLVCPKKHTYVLAPVVADSEGGGTYSSSLDFCDTCAEAIHHNVSWREEGYSPKSILDQLRASLPQPLIVNVMDALVAQYRGAGSVYSPTHFSLQFGPDCGRVKDVLAILALHPFSFLKCNWTYYDPKGDFDIDLSEEEVNQALEENLFIHPKTGAEILDYKNRIGFLYTSTKEFSLYMQDQLV